MTENLPSKKEILSGEIVEPQKKSMSLVCDNSTLKDHISQQNAGVIYLQQFGSENSVRTVRSNLNQVAKFFGYTDYAHCDWG